MRLFRRLASTVTVLLAAGLLLAPAAAADPGFSTGPRIVEHPPSDSPRLVDLRAGHHDTFDRVVFHIDGQIPRYSFRYVPVVHQDGSGLPISLRGSAFLEVVLRGATDIDGRSVLATTRLRPDFPALREVRTDPVSFEGQTVVGVGVSERVGFRVFELTGPNRIVLDLAHPAGDGPAGGPKALTVTPDRGPVGTRVTVEGEDCAPGSARTLLVMQNGGSGTDGMAGLGEFPNDAQGRFRATVTIPDRLDERQGSPGGPTRPGTYAIGSLPPACVATFTVTDGAAGDDGPAGDDGAPGALPFTGARSPLLLAIGGGLLVAGAALLALVRHRQAPAR